MAKHIRTYLNVLFCFIIHPFRLVLKPVTENKTSSGFWEIIKSQFRSELNFFAFFAVRLFLTLKAEFDTYPPICIQFVMAEMI